MLSLRVSHRNAGERAFGRLEASLTEIKTRSAGWRKITFLSGVEDYHG